jgi:hypothetical protein
MVKEVVAGLLALSVWGQVKPLEETGFKTIFDGKTLAGWDCDAAFWSVKNGAITGETTNEHQPPYNIFCIWRGGKPGDFELKLQYRLTGAGGNSGIQYRSVELPAEGKLRMMGYQADIDGQQDYTGQNYEERNRGFLALRGQVSHALDGKAVGSIESLGTSDSLKAFIKSGDWNELDIVARGNVLMHFINGHAMSTVIDDDKANRRMDGEIGIQLHKLDEGMKIEVRNIRIKIF